MRIFLSVMVMVLWGRASGQTFNDRMVLNLLNSTDRNTFAQDHRTLDSAYNKWNGEQIKRFEALLQKQIGELQNLHGLARSQAWRGAVISSGPYFKRSEGAAQMEQAVATAVRSGDEYLLAQLLEFAADYVQLSFGKAQQALFYRLKAAELRKNLDERFFPRDNFDAFTILGDLLFKMQEYPLAIHYIHQSFLFAKNNNARQNMVSLNTLGLSYQRLGRYDSALHWYTLALEVARSRRNPVWAGIIEGNTGAVYFEKGDDASALPLLWNDYRNSIGPDQNNAGNTLHRLALIYLRQGKTDSALLLARRGYAIVSTYPEANPWYVRNGLLAVRNVYRKAGPPDSAYVYADRFTALSDSLARWRAANRADLVQARLDYEQTQNHIAVLLGEKKAEAAWRNGLLVVCALLVIIGVLVVARQRQQHKSRQEALEHQRALAATETEAARQQLNDYMRHLLEKNALIENLQGQLAQQNQATNAGLLQQTILTESDWLRFRQMFDGANPGFLSRLQGLAPEITTAEIRIAALIYLKLGNKDIAAMLGISTDGVRRTKSRLRQRLGLGADEDLEQWVQNLTVPGSVA